MKVFLTGLLFLLAAVASAPGQAKYRLIGEELVKMEKADQEARMKCTALNGDEKIRCFAEIGPSIDVPNVKRLGEIYGQIGFPNTAKVGKAAFQAFLTILQHAPTDDLRVKSLKPIEAAFKKSELSAINYANFVDRLRIHLGKKQLYGSQFDFKDGKLVMSPAADLKNLAKRRVRIGLPPLSEYIKELRELYHMEVEIPKH